MNAHSDMDDENNVPALRPRENENSSAAGAESDVTAWATELERAQMEAAEWKDKFLRKLADFDNYRKRIRQESEMLRQMVAESLMVALLPVMDDFERMLAAPGDADDPLRKGVELIRGKLQAFFDAQGVQKIECFGKPFDPDEHDALMLRATPDFPAGTVLDVITPGYRMGDRVIRHAQVVVSAEAEMDTDADS